MIEFMVIAGPRSSTTWCANFLTTDTTFCHHGLSAKLHHSEWDALDSNKILGVSDTVVSRFHKWLNKHPARKVILHRDGKEICESVGCSEIPESTWCLDKVEGMHVHYMDVFDNPKPIFEFLLQREFDKERHDMLKQFQINTMAHKVKLDKNIHLRIMRELQEDINSAD